MESGKSALELIYEDVLSEHAKSSYRNCLVARSDNKVLGVANFYPGCHFRITSELIKHFGSDKINHISLLFKEDLADSMYIAALITDENYRGQNIGKGLIDAVKQRADSLGLPYVALYVWLDNVGGIRFYERFGFNTTKRVNIGPKNKVNNIEGTLLLMKY